MYRQSHRQAQNTWGQKRFDNLWRFDKKKLVVLSCFKSYIYIYV